MKSVTEQCPLDKLNHLKRIVGALGAALLALAGCSVRSAEPALERPRCELCQRRLRERHRELPGRGGRAACSDCAAEKPTLGALVAPVTLPGGELAAEVDCYVTSILTGPGWFTRTSQFRRIHRRWQSICAIKTSAQMRGRSAESPWSRGFTIPEPRGGLALQNVGVNPLARDTRLEKHGAATGPRKAAS